MKEGGRRYARYVLDPAYAPGPAPLVLQFEDVEIPLTTTELVAESLRILNDASADDLEGLTGFSRPTVVSHLRRLMDAGVAVAEGSRNSPKRRYRWVGPTKEKGPWRETTA